MTKTFINLSIIITHTQTHTQTSETCTYTF